MKRIDNCLYIRGEFYYFRKYFPRNLKAIFSANELVFSLNAQDLLQARLSAVQIEHKFLKILDEVRLLLMKQDQGGESEYRLYQKIKDVEALKHEYSKRTQIEALLPYSHKHLTFAELTQKYMNENRLNSEGTNFHKESTYALFKELQGDLRLFEIDRAIALSFKEKLLKIPSNAKKINNIDSFVGVELDALKGKPQHPKTINNRITYLIALFNWAKKNSYYHEVNPFEGLLIKGAVSKANKRSVFKDEELNRLFSSKEIKNIKYPSLYWVPVIGLYTGMRLNEICQLYISDVTYKEGVLVFDVNAEGEDKNLKNLSSARAVPVPKAVMDIGFMGYVEGIKKLGSKRLFPDIPLGKSKKNYSSIFTKRFIRLMDATGINREGLCFHSFRHTFIDKMRLANVEKAIVMQIVGHSQSKDVHSGYGQGYSLKALREAIDSKIF
jgi:integrase